MKRFIGRRQLKTHRQVQPFDPMKDNVEHLVHELEEQLPEE